MHNHVRYTKYNPSDLAIIGFTLIELSIVLIIIALIIGGVLMGKTMVRSASVRATIGQYEKFNTAVNTFRDKYRKQLPGDMASAKARSYGFYPRSGAPGHGDGNGRIEGCSANEVRPGCENLLFWRDLSQVGLIPGSYTLSVDDIAYTFPPPYPDDFLPVSKLSKDILFTVFTADGKNYYQLAGISGISGVQYYFLLNSITPWDAYIIDLKTDDGMPLTGLVGAITGSALPNVAVTPAAAAAGVCITTATNNPYNTTSKAYADTPACQLKMQFQ